MRYDKFALRRLRKSKGIEVDELAHRAKVARGTVHYADRGVTIPRADTLAKFATALGVEIQDFYDQGAA